MRKLNLFPVFNLERQGKTILVIVVDKRSLFYDHPYNSEQVSMCSWDLMIDCINANYWEIV